MIKVEDELDQVRVAKAYKAEQEHLFRFWSRLTDEQRRSLLDQLGELDFQLLARLTNLIDATTGPHPNDLEPLAPQVATPEERPGLEKAGWIALEAGRVACVVVAGGQGTRLGWDRPKGTYPVGPVTNKSLFQQFAEQILAIGRRAGRPLRWFVLTSRLNREETEAYFREHDFFGLEEGHVEFLVQRDLPNTDFRGKLLLKSTHELATSPNGHGGTLQALHDADALARLTEEGIDHLFYWQVDNPLCRVADPAFLGAHLAANADVSTKVVKKVDPDEKVGVLALRGGLPGVVEYSELSATQKVAREETSGELRYRGGNIAVHLFSVPFLRRLHDSGIELDYHLARKAVPCIDEQAELVQPDEPNAIKFETFIFDVLPHAERHIAFEVTREEEFEPLKNASGAYSPETVARAQSERFASWFAAAGHAPERDAEGNLVHRYEVSPLTALDATELATKLAEGVPEPADGGISL